MKSALDNSMTYRKGLINGASKEYHDDKKEKEDVETEINSLIITAGLGVFLIISGLFLLRIFG